MYIQNFKLIGGGGNAHPSCVPEGSLTRRLCLQDVSRGDPRSIQCNYVLCMYNT